MIIAPTKNDISFEEYDVLRSIERESFWEFVKEFWSIIVPEKPVWNWHIEYLCNELQYVAERVFRGLPKEYDLVINISPGSTKSLTCSVMYPAWIWTRMKSARIIAGSHTDKLAMDLSLKCRDLIKNEHYQKTFPNIHLRPDQDTKSYFMNTKRGSRYAVSVGGSVVGMHGHFLIIDDPLDPEKAISEVELKTANRWMTETLPTRKVDKNLTPTILIMQRLHQDDPSANMIKRGEGQVKHICLPAELSDKVSPPELSNLYKDGLMDPIRLSRQVLQESRKNGEYAYASQFMQDPVPLGGGMFKVERIKIDAFSDKWLRLIRYWDKAGTEGGSGAYTVGLKMGEDRKHRFWIMNVIRGRWDSEERETVIKSTAQLDGKMVEIGLEQEPGSGGKESAESTVRNLRGWRVRVDRPTGDKSLRADPFSVQVNNGNVSMVRGDWNEDYIEELRYFPFSKYKDQVDASSGAFNILAGRNIRAGAL